MEKPITHTDTLLLLSSNDVTGRAGTFVYNLNIAQPPISNSLAGDMLCVRHYIFLSKGKLSNFWAGPMLYILRGIIRTALFSNNM
jgi:hypothetical protein